MVRLYRGKDHKRNTDFNRVEYYWFSYKKRKEDGSLNRNIYLRGNLGYKQYIMLIGGRTHT